jgi:hypothetical protein
MRFDLFLDFVVLFFTTAQTALTVTVVVQQVIATDVTSVLYPIIVFGIYLLSCAIVAAATQSRFLILLQEARNQEDVNICVKLIPEQKFLRGILLLLFNLIIMPFLPLFEYFLCLYSPKYREAAGDTSKFVSWGDEIFEGVRKKPAAGIEQPIIAPNVPSLNDDDDNKNRNRNDDDEDDHAAAAIAPTEIVSTSLQSKPTLFFDIIGNSSTTIFLDPSFSFAGSFQQWLKSRVKSFFRLQLLALYTEPIVAIIFLISWMTRDVTSAQNRQNESVVEIAYIVATIMATALKIGIYVTCYFSLAPFFSTVAFMMQDLFKAVFIFVSIFNIKFTPREVGILPDAASVSYVTLIWIWLKIIVGGLFFVASPVMAFDYAKKKRTASAKIFGFLFLWTVLIILLGFGVLVVEVACFAMLLMAFPQLIGSTDGKFSQFVHEFIWGASSQGNDDEKNQILESIDWKGTFEAVQFFVEDYSKCSELIQKEGEGNDGKDKNNNTNNDGEGVVEDSLNEKTRTARAKETEKRSKRLKKQLDKEKLALKKMSPHEKFARFVKHVDPSAKKVVSKDGFFRRVRHAILFSRFVRFTSCSFVTTTPETAPTAIKNFIKNNENLIYNFDVESISLWDFLNPLLRKNDDETREFVAGENEGILSSFCSSFGFKQFFVIVWFLNQFWSFFFPLLFAIMFMDYFSTIMIVLWIFWIVFLVVSVCLIPSYIRYKISAFVIEGCDVSTGSDVVNHFYVAVDSYFSIPVVRIEQMIWEPRRAKNVVIPIPEDAFSNHVVPFLNSRMVQMYGLDNETFFDLQKRK